MPEKMVARRTSERTSLHAVVCVGVPFGHTRPQWLLPYGGYVTVDGAQRTIWADYH